VACSSKRRATPLNWQLETVEPDACVLLFTAAWMPMQTDLLMFGSARNCVAFGGVSESVPLSTGACGGAGVGAGVGLLVLLVLSVFVEAGVGTVAGVGVGVPPSSSSTAGVEVLLFFLVVDGEAA